MRADRLVATLLLMQARGRVTAAELAAELEVSVATARRDRDRPPLVDALQDAVVRRLRVEIDYRDRGRRAVDPWGLVAKDDVWYLIGGTDKGQRTFRVDRIAQLTITGTGFERPADFDLA